MKKIGDIPDCPDQKRVVIVGGGFAGVKLARKLQGRDYQVVLIDRNNYHVFQPLLYQVATAGVEPSSISFPFRGIFRRRKRFYIRICEALRVVPEQSVLETSIGEIRYDYLVIATGCRSNFFGNSALAAGSMTLKTTAEALYNRNQILDSFERALNTSDLQERQPLLTFVIVGGGPTGIELAGALAEMRKFVLPRDYPDLDVTQMRIILVDSSKRLLGSFSEKSSRYAYQKLTREEVDIRLETTVQEYQQERLMLNNGETIPTANLFWVAGVVANALEGIAPEARAKNRRIVVDHYNRVQGYDHIFAIGDTALMSEPDYPNGHPQVVQPAIQQARQLASNMRRLDQKKSLQPFAYQDKGSMATIGRNRAVIEVKKFQAEGFVAWIIWLFVHLMSIVGVKNRLFIFMNWMWSYLTYDPSLRLVIKPWNKPFPEPQQRSRESAE